MRRDLRNSDGQKVRTGKLIAQGSHASIAFLTNLIRSNNDADIVETYGTPGFHRKLTDVQKEWINGSFFKICVGVDTEQELLDIVEKARTLGVECNLITDLGHTEFNGVPTNTCLALGPDYSSKIDPITGHLKLL